jgi:hypothetical protein
VRGSKWYSRWTNPSRIEYAPRKRLNGPGMAKLHMPLPDRMREEQRDDEVASGKQTAPKDVAAWIKSSLIGNCSKGPILMTQVR